MAKLTPQVAPSPAAAPVVHPATPAVAAPQVAQAPVPFGVVAPSQSGTLKASKKSAEPKVPRLSGDAWFQENVRVGDPSIVKQIQRFASRKNGFHCPPCGIAGSRAIVIEALPGKGSAIQLYDADPITGEMKPGAVVNGFMVGETCLAKYGKIKLSDIKPASAKS